MVENSLKTFKKGFQKILLGIIGAFVFSTLSNAQITYTGIVKDSSERVALPFVNVVVAGTTIGTTSNLDGTFKLTVPNGTNALRFIYLGYKNKDLSVGSKTNLGIIRLAPSGYATKTVEVSAKENPAFRIMKLVMANKNKNDPEKNCDFTYKAHNKLKFFPDPAAFPASKMHDTDLRSLDSAAKMTYFFFSETLSERKFKRPSRNTERIFATRVAGFPDLALTTLASDMQSFTFYQPFFSVLQRRFLSPINSSAFSLYALYLEKELLRGNDTIWTISFEPKKGKTFAGMKGFLQVNSDGYAIENVIAEKPDTGLISFKIQQKYQKVGKQWFPQQLNTDLKLNQYPIFEDIPPVIEARTIISEINTEASLKSRDFGADQIIVEAKATGIPDSVWNKMRPDTLAWLERNTYTVLDTTIGKFKGVQKFMGTMNYLITDKIPLGKIDLDMSRFLKFNVFEGTRLGIGAHTSPKLAEWLTIGGWFGYGTRDLRWKYGGELGLRLSKRTDLWFYPLQYEYTLKEPGTSKTVGYANILSNESLRDFFAFKMDRWESYTSAIKLRLTPFWTMEIKGSRNYVTPLYRYAFFPNVPTGSLSDENYLYTFQVDEARLAFRYTFGQKLMNIFGYSVPIGNRSPIVEFQVSSGQIANVGNYWKFKAYWLHNFETRLLGSVKTFISLGDSRGNLPYFMMWNARGSRIREVPAVVDYTLQTAGLFEFFGNRYATIIFRNRFNPLFKIKQYSAPALGLWHGVHYSQASQQAQHWEIPVKDAGRGFFESGIMLDDIIRYNYVGLAYYGFGVGVFHRYGPYQLPGTWHHNAVFKLTSTISF